MRTYLGYLRVAGVMRCWKEFHLNVLKVCEVKNDCCKIALFKLSSLLEETEARLEHLLVASGFI